MSKKYVVIALIVIFNIAQIGLTQHVLAEADKVTICHAAGREGTLHYETLNISRNAVFQDHGEGGHFYENGTPKAGHEHDYIGACVESTPTPTASPSTSPSAAPSTSPSSAPSSTPAGSTAPSSAPGSSNGGSSSNSASSNNSGNSDSSEGQVLGAYADTGVATDVMMNVLGGLGSVMTAIGTVIYGKKTTRGNRK